MISEKIKKLNRRAEWLKFLILGVIIVSVGVGAGVAGVMNWRKHEAEIAAEQRERVARRKIMEREQRERMEREEQERKERIEREEKERMEREAEARRMAEERKREVERKEILEDLEKWQRGMAARVGKFTGKKLVALTFDDGPNGVTTPRLLDILREKQVRATFFMLGRMMQNFPEVAKRAEMEGHEVESHTMYHNDLTKLSREGVESDMQVTDGVFLKVLGRKPRLMRPPYGAMNEAVRGMVGRPLVYWTVDTLDWKYRNAASVHQRAMAGVFDGAVILMHDIHATSVDAVAGIVDGLRGAGYELVTVGEMAAAKGVKMVPGGNYYGF